MWPGCAFETSGIKPALPSSCWLRSVSAFSKSSSSMAMTKSICSFLNVHFLELPQHWEKKVQYRITLSFVNFCTPCKNNPIWCHALSLVAHRPSQWLRHELWYSAKLCPQGGSCVLSTKQATSLATSCSIFDEVYLSSNIWVDFVKFFDATLSYCIWLSKQS